MANAFLNIFLAFTIFICPIRCQIGMCCSALKCETSSSCCCDQSESDSSDAPTSPKQKCKCSCICNGATLPDCVDLELDLQSQPFVFAEPSYVYQVNYLLDNDIHPPDRISGVAVSNSQNVGRTICFLKSSLII